MPRRTRSYGVARVMSSPSSAIVPVFTGTTPIRLFSSVVLPTPLRPSTTVISPTFASKPTLRRMWLPP